MYKLYFILALGDVFGDTKIIKINNREKKEGGRAGMGMKLKCMQVYGNAIAAVMPDKGHNKAVK